MENYLELALEAYQRNYDALLRFALSILKNQHAAEEVIQDLCIKILERSDLFKNVAAGKLKSYFATTIYRASLNRRKEESRLLELDPDHPSSMLSADDPKLIDVEVRELFDQLTEQWPKDVREAFVLHVVSGIPLKEIAQSMGIKPNTLTQRVNRWRKKLDTSLLLFILLHMLYG